MPLCSRPGRYRVIALFLCCCFASAPRADVLERWYASLGLGWSYAETLKIEAIDAEMDLDRGTDQLSGALGRRLSDQWRLELGYQQFDRSPELLYSSSAAIEIDTDERDRVSASSLTLNLIRDVRIGRAWRPYLGAGIGTGHVKVHYSEPEIYLNGFRQARHDIIDDDNSGMAWQVIAGVTIPLTRRLELATDFRFWKMPDVHLEDVDGTGFDTAHSVRSAWLHLRYHGPDAGVFDGPPPRQPPGRGWYLTANAGGGFAQDEDIEGQDLVIDAFALGPAASAGIGYHLGPRWRIELEASYWENGVEVMEFDKQIGEDSASGKVESASVMLNVLHQFAPGSSVRPFVGLGGGWVRSSYQIDTAGFCRNFVCTPVEQRLTLVDDHGTAVAAQAMFGVDVAINDRWHFTIAYRQLLTGSSSMERLDGAAFDIDKRFVSSVQGGFRYDLGR